MNNAPAAPRDPADLARRLTDTLKGYGSCAVAFSAGVDSTVVVKAACLALGERGVAVTGVGPALAQSELADARRLAAQVGVRHIEVPTDESQQPGYIRNAPDRCFHCKTELYTHVERVAQELGLAVLCNGANSDDLGDYRPGMQAARDFEVRSPLVECGMTKADVRALAKHWDLSVWDKPAAPCLASRIAYGVQVTPERLGMIEQAERYVRSLGATDLRVRLHPGELARIEVPADEIARLCAHLVRTELAQRFRDIGFSAVTIDLEGLRSGNLNELIEITLSS
ncbi:hypothetical protein Pla175_19970 [Pirellulimonas nuda]|uniref:tRNA-specific 2-thiouridylase MnmA n=1 Tax=Pirellulimonas nuda TaxID=2528009 RepID=A0A518DAV4_9BACT|nr:ATP-dependent sacrificial sulfur transferase LarE [Pirellulimonas nuda]QDU88617.1 hypothetical protein Pla175_19970 [Pirellulimonas nuda]